MLQAHFMSEASGRKVSMAISNDRPEQALFSGVPPQNVSRAVEEKQEGHQGAGDHAIAGCLTFSKTMSSAAAKAHHNQSQQAPQQAAHSHKPQVAGDAQ